LAQGGSCGNSVQMQLLNMLSTVLLASVAGATSAPVRGHDSLLQTWQAGAFAASGASRDTPVTRVVGLLKEMQTTLEKEMKDDEELYDKLACWCNNNEYEKDEAIAANEAKRAELNSTIHELTAKSSELTSQITSLEEEVATNKNALAEASALREKELKEFHSSDLDSTQAVENLRAAIEVLGKHQGSSFPQLGFSFLQHSDKKNDPWTEAHEASHRDHSLDEFMSENGFGEEAGEAAARPISEHLRGKKAASAAQVAPGWSADDAAVVRVAMRSASSFMQAHNKAGYYPSYSSQSGEIMGVLKQLKEEMEGDSAAARKDETERAAAFAEMRTAKEAEISNGEAMSEKKEDELATAKNNLAEAKEDLAQEEATLTENQKFMANLKVTCADADENFDERKKARLSEINAVSETISVLMADEARDTFSSTYSFLQTSDDSHRHDRTRAVQLLRQAAHKTNDPKLAVLATAVQLDSFTRVKKAIDDMVAMLKVEQADEVKKNDFCNDELHENDMTTQKTEDRKSDLEAKEADLESALKTLEDDLASAHSQISELQVNLQRANEDRQKTNMQFQQTVADQTATVELLKKALDKLATYYDEAALLQQKQKQTPPVAQKEYSPNKGAQGVMQLIEKLVVEAKDMSAEAKKAESEAQSAYEQIVADTNGSVAALQKEIATKTQTKAETNKDKLQTGADIVSTVDELEGLSKYNAQLHAECDYLTKNFDVRQQARAQEIEALQQAKQILSGASLN